MYFKLPTSEAQNYLDLAGMALANEELQEMVKYKFLQSFVKDMKLSMIVKIEHADKLYLALNTGECRMGLKGIEIYRIVPPIQVDDVEGKTQINLSADLVFVEPEEKVD